MVAVTRQMDVPAVAYPKLHEAARILRVSPATLTRRQLPTIRAGRRDKHVTALVVLREAAFQRRRRVRDVAADLLDYARAHAPEAVDHVRAEIEQGLREEEQHGQDRPTVDELLEDARAALPPELYERAVAIFARLDTLPRPTGFGLSDEEIQAADQVRKRLRR